MPAIRVGPGSSARRGRSPCRATVSPSRARSARRRARRDPVVDFATRRNRTRPNSRARGSHGPSYSMYRRSSRGSPAAIPERLSAPSASTALAPREQWDGQHRQNDHDQYRASENVRLHQRLDRRRRDPPPLHSSNATVGCRGAPPARPLRGEPRHHAPGSILASRGRPVLPFTVCPCPCSRLCAASDTLFPSRPMRLAALPAGN